MNLLQKLLEIQKGVDALGKDSSSGTGNYGYKYVSGDKVLGYIRPKMNELGLLLKPEVISIENERMDYTTAKGIAKSEMLSKVIQRYTWIDIESGEREECLWGANGQNDWDKGLGSALTYGERYFLLKFFHIPTDEDDVDYNKKSQNNAPANTSNKKASAPTANNAPKPAAEKEWLDLTTADGKDTEAFTTIKASLKTAKPITLAKIQNKYKVSRRDIETLKELGIK